MLQVSLPRACGEWRSGSVLVLSWASRPFDEKVELIGDGDWGNGGRPFPSPGVSSESNPLPVTSALSVVTSFGLWRWRPSISFNADGEAHPLFWVSSWYVDFLTRNKGTDLVLSGTRMLTREGQNHSRGPC